MKPVNPQEIDPRVWEPNFAMQAETPDAEFPDIQTEAAEPIEDNAPSDTGFRDIQPDTTQRLAPPRPPERTEAVGHKERQEGKPFAFALAHGTGGASIWWGQLAACVCTVTVTRENGTIRTITQDTISKPIYYAPSNLDTDTRLQTHLGWYGDVYLYWKCDENGMITAVEVKGPDTPDGENIGELDADLNRTVTDGKYWVLIGTVDEGSPVVQKISSDVPWFATIIKGSSGSSGGSDGSEGSSSGTSTSSDGSLGSDKSTAIVPVSFYSTGYAALFTLEAPDVRFEDVVTIKPKRRKFSYRLDKRFVEVCEADTLSVVSACPSSPALVGASISGASVDIEIVTRKRLPATLTLKISGIRRGFRAMRFPSRTEEQFLANERFLNSAYPRK